jgi:hypothetical protein
MKSVYAVAFMSLLVSRSTSLGEDPKRPDIEAQHDELLKRRMVCIAPATSVPRFRNYPVNPHNQSLTAIGGPATKSKNAAVIDGAGMKRR